MEQAVFTTLCMVSDGNGSVLVQERVGGRWQGVAFPGGHVEPGESFTKSVVREVKEETGYTLENPRLCGIKQFPTDEGRVFWVKRDEIERYELAHDMAEMLPLFEDDGKSEFYCFAKDGEWSRVIL
jgi:8-oxo-dGTP diphosphatase